MPPVYFMTEDDLSKGLTQVNIFSGAPFEAVGAPSNIESVIATLPTGPAAPELWKLNHYYERLDDWYEDMAFAESVPGPGSRPHLRAAQPHPDPEERHNLARAPRRVGTDAVGARRATGGEAAPACAPQPRRLTAEGSGGRRRTRPRLRRRHPDRRPDARHAVVRQRAPLQHDHGGGVGLRFVLGVVSERGVTAGHRAGADGQRVGSPSAGRRPVLTRRSG